MAVKLAGCLRVSFLLTFLLLVARLRLVLQLRLELLIDYGLDHNRIQFVFEPSNPGLVLVF